MTRNERRALNKRRIGYDRMLSNPDGLDKLGDEKNILVAAAGAHVPYEAVEEIGEDAFLRGVMELIEAGFLNIYLKVEPQGVFSWMELLDGKGNVIDASEDRQAIIFRGAMH